MAVNKDMFHAQTTPSNQLFNTACKVLDSVSKLKERNARKCRGKSVMDQKTKMNLRNYKLNGVCSKDEFTDIKSFKERVNDFIKLVEKDNARRIRIDFTIEWEKG